MSLLATKLNKYIIVSALAAVTGSVLAEPDWSAVEMQKMTVFYPGVASWDYLTSDDHGKGQKSVSKNKKSCAECHISKKGEYEILADEIVTGELTMVESGKKFEPAPQKGLEAFVEITLQAAYDDTNMYLKVTWPSEGTSFNDVAVAESGLADRLSVQFANDSVKSFENYGCFTACHDDMKDMPQDAGRELYAEFSKKKGKPLPQKILDKFQVKGMLIDQWVAAFHGSEIKVTDEYIISDRTDDNVDVKATGSYVDGNYSIVFTRALNTADKGDVPLVDGEQVTFNIAIHDKKQASRYHYTSFPFTLGLGGKKADIIATKL